MHVCIFFCIFAAEMLSMKQYKAIFLDWDQTIGDWEGAEYQALQDIYAHYRLSEWYDGFEDYLAVYKARNLELWQLYGEQKVTKEYLHRERFLYPMLKPLGLDAMPCPPKAMVELADKIGKEFLALTNVYFRLLPDAEQVVKYLAQKYPLTIISNGFSEVQYYKFEHSGLKPYLKHILISEEVGCNKPQPGIFEEALRRNGVSKDEAIMIGDSYSSDIAGAKAADIDQIWVTTEETDKDATYKVTTLAEIMNIL